MNIKKTKMNSMLLWWRLCSVPQYQYHPY